MALHWPRQFLVPAHRPAGKLFDSGGNDYELFAEDDEFVLSVEMPGFDTEEITAPWDDGVLDIAAEHEDDRRGERKTYHRRFRFPKNVESDDLEAEYTNGCLNSGSRSKPVRPRAAPRSRPKRNPPIGRTD